MHLTNPSDSLEDLLNESIKLKERADEEKELRRKVNRRQGTEQEIAADAQRLRKWSMEREWKRGANLLSFSRQKCSTCGAFHTTLIGRFEIHDSQRHKGATTSVRVAAFELDLPKQVTYLDEVVTVCHSCADFAGWPVEED